VDNQQETVSRRSSMIVYHRIRKPNVWHINGRYTMGMKTTKYGREVSTSDVSIFGAQWALAYVNWRKTYSYANSVWNSTQIPIEDIENVCVYFRPAATWGQARGVPCSREILLFYMISTFNDGFLEGVRVEQSNNLSSSIHEVAPRCFVYSGFESIEFQLSEYV
jgi:hypothetical protein